MNMQRLREIAECAAKGPWVTDAPMLGRYEDRFVGMLPEGDGYRAVVAAPDAPTAEHIATFDPPTVLALLDVAEAAELVAGPGFDIAEKAALNDALARLREVTA